MFKIIYIVESPCTPRDRKRYGIDQFEDAEIWDLTCLFNPKQISLWTTRGDVERDLSQVPFHIPIVCLIGYRPNSLWLYRLLRGRIWGLLEMNITPTHPKKDTPWNLIKRARRLSLAKLVSYVFPRIPYRLLGVSPASFQVLGGSMTDHHSYPINSNTVTLRSHHPDLDIAKEAGPPIIAAPSCVFLDEYLPFHPDYAYQSKVPPYNADEYYALLRNLFQRIKRQYGIKVVVALHPRAESDKGFHGYETYQGNTAQLVKYSEFVITHASNSVNFAILFEKPILLTVTQAIKKDPHEYGIVQWMSKWLNQVPTEIDRTFDLPKTMTFDKEVYVKYQNAYIGDSKTQSVGKVLQDLFHDQQRNLRLV